MFAFRKQSLDHPKSALFFYTLLVLYFVLGSLRAEAQYATAELPSVQNTTAEILDVLLPEQQTDQTRGISREAPGSQVDLDAPKATLLVEFETGTDFLSVNGMKTLRELSLALTDNRLAGYRFQIAAHGYATADPQLQVRTARRAQQIVEHLAAFYPINVGALQPIGVGARYVLNLESPNDPMNFRIEVFRITG